MTSDSEFQTDPSLSFDMSVRAAVVLGELSVGSSLALTGWVD
jgi:hypothetical protein